MTSWLRRACALSFGLALSLACLTTAGDRAHAAPTEAAYPPPTDLRVIGGEENWHWESGFQVEWELPSTSTTPVAAHYRVRDELGQLVTSEMTIGWGHRSATVTVPGLSGIFAFEVWLDYSGGASSPVAKAKLRLDSQRPGATVPISSGDWIGRNAIPYAISLAHPNVPLPVSGIRGYAVAVDGETDGDPCAAIAHCAEDEIDLRGGIRDDRYVIPILPEGTSYVHAVAVSGSGMKSDSPGTVALRVDKTDPVTTLSGVPQGWTNQAVTLSATARDSLSGMAASGDGGPFTAIRVDGGTPKTSNGNTVSAAVIGEGTHTVAFYARDAAGNVNDGGTNNGQPNAAPSVATIRIDKQAPKASFASTQSAEDPESLEVRVSDPLSGPHGSRGSIAVRPLGSNGEFEVLPTEVTDAGLRARWDSQGYPNGPYEFQATAYDAVGNSVTTTKRTNGTRMVLSNPLKDPTELRAGFGGKVLTWHRCVRREGRRHCRVRELKSYSDRPSRRVVPHGRNVLFSGRLIATPRFPLPQMPVQVVERFDPGSNPFERVTTVRTGALGTFSVKLAPGPSRQVFVAFGGTRTLARAGTTPVRLGIRGAVSMHASSPLAKVGGRPIVFGGKVDSAGTRIPPDGKSVQLQFRVGRLPWSEFRTVQTDAHGRFRYVYSFTDDDSRGVEFEFRALAPRQSGWPYEPGASKPIVVRGT